MDWSYLKIRKPKSIHLSSWEVLFVSASTLVMLCLYFLVVPFLELVEFKAYDLHFRQRGRLGPSGMVAFVTIDEESIKRDGRWPWPRRQIAELLEAVASYNPRVIGMDMGFFEPDLKLRQGAILELEERFSRDADLAPCPEVATQLQMMADEEDDDVILARTLHDLPVPLVMGQFFFFDKDGYTPEAAPADVVENTSFRIVHMKEEPRGGTLNEAIGIEANIPIVRQASAYTGSFNVFADPDGTVRWMPLVIRYGNHLFPSVALQMLSVSLPQLPLIVKADSLGIEDIRLGAVSIPTNNRGELLVNFYGPAYTFPHFSASVFLHNEAPPDCLDGKLVVIGNTTVGLHDMRPTPFSPVFPGVELHCTVVENILQEQFLKRSERTTPYYDAAALLTMAAVFLLLQSFLRGAVLGSAVMALLGGYIVATHYFFLHSGIWLNHVYPSLNLIVGFVGTSLHRYRKEEREKRMIRQTFGLYVHESVVQEMLANPEKLKLGGEKQELTVLFSYIRGFTTLSEQLPPEEIVPQLNEYLTHMTQVVLDHHGTLDKYIGDAIMAIFGAPLPQPDHPFRACATALSMIKTLHLLHQEWTSRGRPVLKIGIGVNTGLMMVGNMGSERRFDYTVIGDNVNLAERLEGLTKMYGVDIVVSETTWAVAKDGFVGRELDMVRVKGKTKPAAIYQLMDTAENIGSYRQPLALFAEALKWFREKNVLQALELFNQVADLWPGDPPSLLYRKRCEELLAKKEHGDDWSHITVFDKK
jgi:adenylate cyclase